MENWDQSVVVQGSSSVWDLLKRFLAKGILKQELTGIEVTTFVGVNNFRNI